MAIPIPVEAVIAKFVRIVVVQKIDTFIEEEISWPKKYDEYLAQIYGNDFLNHNPAEKRIDSANKIEISASILDLEKSYRCYIEPDM